MPRHYQLHGGTGSREYVSWRAMVHRCVNPKAQGYRRYGGRGITVCDRWRDSFQAFLADVGPCPSPAHSIDRIDNDGHYEPGNCRWATRKEQCRNTSRNRRITAYGRSMTAPEWSEITGIPADAIISRVNLGWSHEDAISRPIAVWAIRRRKRTAAFKAKYARLTATAAVS